MPTWTRIVLTGLTRARRGIGPGGGGPDSSASARSISGPTRPPCSGLGRVIATRRPAGSSCTSRENRTSEVTSTAG